MKTSLPLRLLACTGFGVRLLLNRSIDSERRMDIATGNPEFKIGVAACWILRTEVTRTRACWHPLDELGHILAVMNELIESNRLEEGEYNSGIGTVRSIRERLLLYCDGIDPGY